MDSSLFRSARHGAPRLLQGPQDAAPVRQDAGPPEDHHSPAASGALDTEADGTALRSRAVKRKAESEPQGIEQPGPRAHAASDDRKASGPTPRCAPSSTSSSMADFMAQQASSFEISTALAGGTAARNACAEAGVRALVAGKNLRNPQVVRLAFLEVAREAGAHKDPQSRLAWGRAFATQCPVPRQVAWALTASRQVQGCPGDRHFLRGVVDVLREPARGALSGGDFLSKAKSGCAWDQELVHALFATELDGVPAHALGAKIAHLKRRNPPFAHAVLEQLLAPSQRGAVMDWVRLQAQVLEPADFSRIARCMDRKEGDPPRLAMGLFQSAQAMGAVPLGLALVGEEERSVSLWKSSTFFDSLYPLASSMDPAKGAEGPASMHVVRVLLGIRERLPARRLPDAPWPPPVGRYLAVDELLDAFTLQFIEACAAHASEDELVETGFRFMCGRADAAAPQDDVPRWLDLLYPLVTPARVAPHGCSRAQVRQWLEVGMRLPDLGPSTVATLPLPWRQRLDLLARGEWAVAANPQDVCERLREGFAVVVSAASRRQAASRPRDFGLDEAGALRPTLEECLSLLGSVLAQNRRWIHASVVHAVHDLMLSPATAQLVQKNPPLAQVLLMDALSTLYRLHAAALGLSLGDEALAIPAPVDSPQAMREFCASLDGELNRLRSEVLRLEDGARSEWVLPALAIWQAKLARLDAAAQAQGYATGTPPSLQTGPDPVLPDSPTLDEAHHFLRELARRRALEPHQLVPDSLLLANADRNYVMGQALASQSSAAGFDALLCEFVENGSPMSPMSRHMVQGAFEWKLAQRTVEGLTADAAFDQALAWAAIPMCGDYAMSESYEYVNAWADAVGSTLRAGQVGRALDAFLRFPDQVLPGDVRKHEWNDGVDFRSWARVLYQGLPVALRPEATAWLARQAQVLTDDQYLCLAAGIVLDGAGIAEQAPCATMAAWPLGGSALLSGMAMLLNWSWEMYQDRMNMEPSDNVSEREIHQVCTLIDGEFEQGVNPQVSFAVCRGLLGLLPELSPAAADALYLRLGSLLVFLADNAAPHEWVEIGHLLDRAGRGVPAACPLAARHFIEAGRALFRLGPCDVMAVDGLTDEQRLALFQSGDAWRHLSCAALHECIADVAVVVAGNARLGRRMMDHLLAHNAPRVGDTHRALAAKAFRGVSAG